MHERSRKGEETLSTRSSLKYEREEGTGRAFHLYEEVFDDENIYLEFQGFRFELAISTLSRDDDPPRLVVQLPRKWARKLGLVEGENQDEAKTGKRNED